MRVNAPKTRDKSWVFSNFIYQGKFGFRLQALFFIIHRFHTHTVIYIFIWEMVNKTPSNHRAHPLEQLAVQGLAQQHLKTAAVVLEGQFFFFLFSLLILFLFLCVDSNGYILIIHWGYCCTDLSQGLWSKAVFWKGKMWCNIAVVNSHGIFNS